LALPTGRFIPIALLPVNVLSLLSGKIYLLALFMGQFRSSHVGIREIASLEAGPAKVGKSQVCPHEIDFAEKRSTEIASRKVGVREGDLSEVIPA
jgi:hypothetical protein